jgi:hypothetical protein
VGKLTFHDFLTLSSNEDVFLASGSGRFTSEGRTPCSNLTEWANTKDMINEKRPT